MEIFLLAAIFALLFYILTTFKNRFDQVEDQFDELNRKIALLKIIQKPTEKNGAPSTPVIEKEKTITIFEKTEPLPFEPSKKDAIEETKKAIFALDSTPQDPKLRLPTIEQKIEAPIIPETSFWENFKEKNPDLEKFIGENLINKIGVLILVLGISYFVKYAIDKDWINEPARVGIGILCGAVVMGIAHKLRQNYAAFSSVIVAGAIAIFYFTIGIAFHDYHLFNQSVAFGIMVIITAFSALISLSYDRIELAILSLIGGFAVPFMVSTGAGNYVILFSYITILNIGILALAYHKKWDLVNVLAYVFTVLLYGGWLFKEMDTDKPHYSGALVFVFVFYFIFILMNIINNIRTKGEFSKTQLIIVASNTFLFYGAGMAILVNYHPEFKGLFTLLIAILNLIYAWFLYAKFGLDKKAVYLLIGMTLTFATLAIPIQFEGNYITLFWAAEAVLLLWLSQKSKITSYRFGSVIVHFLMIISLIMDWDKFYRGTAPLHIIINPIFSTGLFAMASLFAVYYLLNRETEKTNLLGFTFNPEKYRKYVLGLGIAISYFIGFLEISYQSANYIENTNTSAVFPVIYHLMFFAILTTYLMKIKTDSGYKAATLIAISNIILFTFWFSNYAFKEHQEIITTEKGQPIAFYLHYISLFLIIYFGYQLYQMNAKKVVFEIFNKKMYAWIAAFFVIYIASTEIMLHGLVLLNSPVIVQDVQASSLSADYRTDLNYLRETIAIETIDTARTKITKTGYPVLWGILAFVFLIVGIKKQVKTLRIIALTLLGLTIVKLFLFDISNVSETGKIISFILLGVLILIISFVYQKIKVLVIDENKTYESDEPK